MQSRVVVDGPKGEVEAVVKGVLLLIGVGIGVVGHGLDWVLTLQDALHNATWHHPKPSVAL